MRTCLLCGDQRRAGLTIRGQVICRSCLKRLLRRDGVALSAERRRRLNGLYGSAQIMKGRGQRGGNILAIAVALGGGAPDAGFPRGRQLAEG